MAAEISGLPGGEKHRFYKKYGKRIFDVFFSLLAILVLSPLLLLLWLLVRVRHGAPVLFSPTRPGKDERIFHIYKFKSMSSARDANGLLLPDRDRITGLGRILRATSMDELPELFNILKGDMSFVGPRPLTKGSLPGYSDEERLRFSVRPGLTGLAQIHGRNDLPWDQRFQYDLEYIRRMSLFYDVRLILETVLAVFRSEVTVPGTHLGSSYAHRQIQIQGQAQPMGENGRRAEIGGDFWLEEEKPETPPAPGHALDDWLPPVQDSAFTFVGRSAIELALADLLAQRPVRKACVPAYCSFGMLQPFIERDIAYEFYDVSWEDGGLRSHIDPERGYDAALVIDWFGMDDEQTARDIAALRKTGCAVIEDITHTLLGRRKRPEQPDYYAASLRKWFPIPAGGWLGKTGGALKAKPDVDGGTRLEDMISAMRLKRDYISGASQDKQTWLSQAAEFEMWLVLLNCRTRMDSLSEEILRRQDIPEIMRRRRENARRLHEKLSGIPQLTLMNTPEDWDRAAPIGVPALLKHEDRNALADALARQGIYCPVTWPERMGAEPGIRTQELTLICDQRYTVADMDRMAAAIAAFFAGA